MEKEIIINQLDSMLDDMEKNYTFDGSQRYAVCVGFIQCLKWTGNITDQIANELALMYLNKTIDGGIKDAKLGM